MRIFFLKEDPENDLDSNPVLEVPIKGQDLFEYFILFIGIQADFLRAEKKRSKQKKRSQETWQEMRFIIVPRGFPPSCHAQRENIHLKPVWAHFPSWMIIVMKVYKSSVFC
jgi:hypothetical protein